MKITRTRGSTQNIRIKIKINIWEKNFANGENLWRVKKPPGNEEYWRGERKALKASNFTW